MKKKQRQYIIFGVIAALVLVVAGYFIGQKDSSTVLAKGELEVVETYYDFGTVGLDPISHGYVIKNTGAGPVTIAKVSTSCGCTSAQLKTSDKTSQTFAMDHGNLPRANFILEPGEEAEVIVTYNPLAHGLNNAAGRFRRMVYVKTENPRDEYTFSFDVIVDPDKQAEKNPVISVDQISYDFGKIPKTGGVVERVFEIANTGDDTLVISDITTSCGCTSAELSKTSISAGKSENLTVRFDPDFHDEPQGKLERTITLFTNDPNNPEFNVKIYAEIIE